MKCGNLTKGDLYLLDITDQKENSQGKYRFTALAKCRKDPATLLLGMGAKDLGLHIYSLDNHSRWVRSFLWRWNALHLWRQLRCKLKNIKQSVVFIQYPLSSTALSAAFILRRLKRSGNRVILLVHDMESIRLGLSRAEKVESYLLVQSDCVILHSSAMIERAKEIAPNGRFVPLEFFDYASELDLPEQSDLRNIRLIYAGNLGKSAFLKKIDSVNFSDSFQLFLYGAYSANVNTSNHVIYKGKFDAEQFDAIEGNWGLVWDGDSIDTCSGNFGEYLRLNAPFKFSLYLAAKRPVVVWKESAMAEYVRKYHLGITVGGLNEIPQVVAALTENELKEIRAGIERASADVRSCNKLRTALLKASNMINVF